MNRTINRINNRVSRLSVFGVSAIFGYALFGEYISPFIPLIVTILGSLIAGSLVRLIFVRLLNRRLFSTYRYTDTKSTRSRQGNTGNSAESRERINTAQDSLALYRNLLGLGQRFTTDELKTAYRSSAAKYHPDRYASATNQERKDAEDLMKKVNEAYDRLKAAAV